MTSETAPKPLTPEQFSEFVSTAGHRLNEDENGYRTAYGHLTDQEFADLCTEFDRYHQGADADAWTTEMVAAASLRRVWAVVEGVIEPADEWVFSYPPSNDASTPGAFPITFARF